LEPTGERTLAFVRLVNQFCSSTPAMLLAVVVVIAWALTGPMFRYSATWQAVIGIGTSIITFLMVFVLNSAQSRDTAAINAKLDALIAAINEADNRTIGLEQKDDAHTIHAEIVAAAAEAQAEAAAEAEEAARVELSA
jgi:low affinity Fe/Cu permease